MWQKIPISYLLRSWNPKWWYGLKIRDLILILGFPGGSGVKNSPALQGMRVWSLGQEDPLEEEMATHSSILAWEIPWTEEPGGWQSMGLQESDMTSGLSNKTLILQDAKLRPFPCRNPELLVNIFFFLNLFEYLLKYLLILESLKIHKKLWKQ